MTPSVGIRLEIDPAYHDPEVIIRTDQRTPLVEKLIYAIENSAESDHPMIPVYWRDTLVPVSPREIIRIYTENRKIIVCTDQHKYDARLSLRELEEKLDPDRFIRISRFEIVNLRKIASFDFSVAGSIRIRFEDGSETWVARRYVQTIQQTLNRYTGRKEGNP